MVSLTLNDTSTRMLQKGDEASFACTVNQGRQSLVFLNQLSVEWYHESSWGGEEKQQFLFRNTQRKDADPDEWQMWMGINGYNILYRLKLLSTSAKHNGRILCEIGKGDKRVTQEANIVVYDNPLGHRLGHLTVRQKKVLIIPLSHKLTICIDENHFD